MANIVANQYEQEAQEIARRRAFAEALRQQGMTPIQTDSVGGVRRRTGVLDGLNKLVQAYSGRVGVEQADQQTRDLQTRRQEALKGFFKSMPQDQQTTQQQLIGDRPGAGSFENVTTTKKATPEDYMKWLASGTEIGPEAVQIGQVAYQNAVRGQERGEDRAFRADTLKEDRAFREQQAAEARTQRIQELELRLEDSRLSREQNADLRRELAQLAAAAKQAGGGARPYFTAVPTTGGIGSFDNRKGTMSIITDASGKPMVKPSDDPTLQGKIAGEKDRAQAEVKRDMNMSGIGDIITSARGILENKEKPPTQSGLGNVVDMMASTVGIAPPGSEEADQLRAIGGMLVSKMPRMEGPQSNYDVQNYKEMAGQVGNPNLPISRRLAALTAVEELTKKYSKPAAVFEDGAPPPGAVRLKGAK